MKMSETGINGSKAVDAAQPRKSPNGLLLSATVNEVIRQARKKPMPRRLFGDMWMEGELCILFADTGKGKSILAMQIADAITKGRSVGPLEMSAGKKSVLYLDFELSDKQVEMRYAEEPEKGEGRLVNHYLFSDYMIRATVDLQALVADAETDGERLFAELDAALTKHKASVLVVDNITFLGATQGSTAAFLLMRRLKNLCTLKDMSILVLAHTPKRETWQPISVNDLQGSKHLANFADNIFAIGQSRFEPELRYVKHIKPRSTELLYDSEHVPTFTITKQNGNFLSFKFDSYWPESAHLASYGRRVINDRITTAQSLARQGHTQRSIANQMEISLGSVNRYLQMSVEED